MFTLSTVSWIIFIIAILTTSAYGIKNRRHITYPCQIEQRFKFCVSGCLFLAVILMMINVIMNPTPPC